MQDNSGSTKNIFDALSRSDADAACEFVFGDEGEDATQKEIVFSFGEEPEEKGKKEASVGLLFEEEKSNERPVELSVPDKFKVDEKYDVPSQTEDSPRIITTYVPRFTDASKNYRMRDERATPIKGQAPLSASSDEATREFEGDVDPTAEIDPQDNRASAVIVNKREPEELESATTVFKFAADEAPEPLSEVQTPAQTDNDSEIEEASAVLSETEESKSEESKSEEPRVYSIPDPVDAPEEKSERSVSVSLASQTALADAPDGIGERLPVRQGAREYDALSKRDGFKERFLDNIMSIRVRFFAALVISIFALLFECLTAFGVNLAEALGIVGIPAVLALLDAQFALALYLLALPETIRAFVSLAHKKATADLFLTAAFAVLLIYTSVIVAVAPIKYPLYAFLYSIYVLSSIGASHFKASADFMAFKRISQNGEKLVCDIKLTRTLERENAALDGMIEEYKSRTVRTFRTLFVPDFFGRTTTPVGRNSSIALILGASFGLSVVTAVIALFIPGGWDYAVSALALVFLLSCPAFSILVNKLPAYHAQSGINAEQSAVIGEQALSDYASADVITFADSEVFGAEDVSLQRIKLYGRNDNLAKALRQMAALFMNVGGPLSELFTSSLDRKCAPATDVKVYPSGISGIVEGSEVFAGTLEFMSERGINILPDTDGRFEHPSDSTKIMYAAENGEAYAKFYIRYSFSEEFSMLLPTLEDYGITPLVYTRDPNVTRQLLVTLTAGADKIRVVKKNDLVSNDSVVYNSVSAALVTTGGKNSAINSIIIAKKYAALEGRFAISELISMAVGGVLAAVLSIGGMALVPSVILAAWHVIWCGALQFISKKSLRIDGEK